MSNERKKLIDKLDKIVSKYVVLRDGKCITCWATYALCCGHLFSRVWMATRFNLKNCNASCQICNGIHEVNETPYRNAFIKKYSKEEYELLDTLHNKQSRFTIQELEEIYNNIKQKYDKLV